MSAHSHDDKSKLPVPYKPNTQKRPDEMHHTQEWSRGTHGGGKVPQDFVWPGSPKQKQEEEGTN